MADDEEAAWRPPSSRASEPVEQLAGYDDLVEVGRGGDSVVYRARQTSLDREVAIKVLRVDDPGRASRFRREVAITVGLGRQHPNIVNVLATGTTASGRPAIVMDFFEGGTLHDRLRDHGPLPAAEVARIGVVLADALSFAHERGVLHRDVKPQNVLVLPTSWVLADFGIARLADSEHTSSADTFTYRHAAPQVLDGLPPTAADDLWSLGSTLFTLLDGRPPFASDDPDDDSALAYLRRARIDEPRALEAPDAEAIAPVIERCLRKDPTERWPDAAALRDALASLRTSAWEPGPSRGPVADRVRDSTAPRPTGDTGSHGAPAEVAAAPRPAAAAETPEPPPVALSVASHAPRAVDAAPTGTGLPDRTGPDPSTPPGARAPSTTGPEAPDADGADATPPSRRRLVIGLVAVALAVGVVLGLVGHALRHHDRDSAAPPPSDPSTTLTVPTLASSPTDVPTFDGKPDPKLSFVLRTISYDGVNLHLVWTDPSQGQGAFYVLRVLPDEDLVAAEPAGTEEADVQVTLPPGRSCYEMVVRLATGDFGTSGQSRCVTVK